ncbi:GTPase, G3E family [Desulfocicer vacuolatum DSM 3385]|uniref:GTPase, G3E family n=1 Tax=Desulfocicer vacuolatum DSM 3385 TaxID=1121400 RepID=A0A1W2ETF2_9BACT|nr:GTP-binding protein [Desulfocicer vacuolatum]SMD12862.1 GTPase, G3E family [Desulfocicer vacuolatum DSM 3385]
MSKTDVFLITGFLGSGKTTFLNRIIDAFPKDRKLMILMNEFGEIGIDGTLVEHEDVDMLEISKGSIFCVCVKTDFIKGLMEIVRTIRPDTLLIEATGVANPADLKRDLKLPIFKDRFEMKEQFCIVDAPNFQDAYDTFSSVEKQIESSSLFIINKIDLTTGDTVSTVKELISRHHPDPKFMETSYAKVPLDGFLHLTSPEEEEMIIEPGEFMSGSELDKAIQTLLNNPFAVTTPPDRLISAVYTWDASADLKAFKEITHHFPKGIVRAKGYLGKKDDIRLFNRVMDKDDFTRVEYTEKLSELIHKLIFIGSPEAMQEMETVSAEIPFLNLLSTHDAMA